VEPIAPLAQGLGQLAPFALGGDQLQPVRGAGQPQEPHEGGLDRIVDDRALDPVAVALHLQRGGGLHGLDQQAGVVEAEGGDGHG
jgi:hypothetical protein